MKEIFVKLKKFKDELKIKWKMITQVLSIRDIAKRQDPDYIPALGEVSFGDLRRVKPISGIWGFDRGGPVDRYYIEKFLQQNAADIKGHAFEIKENHYVKMFGGDKVTKMDIVDVNPNNPRATVIADITQADNIPSDTYDCIVLTQVLQLIYELRSAIKHLHRVLKPGGVLLITVPGISQFVYKRYGPYWFWSFTELSLRSLLLEVFEEDKIETKVHGNVLISASFLYGIGSGELKEEEYNYSDPDYQFLITARAVK